MAELSARFEKSGHVQNAAHAIEVIFVDLAASADLLDDAEAASRYLSADDLARSATRAAHVHDGGLWRLTRIALRIALERHLGPEFRRREFEIESGGRPRVPASFVPAKPVEFSLSHSGGAALIAISAALPVGVDLEAMRELRMGADREARIESAGAALAPAFALSGTGDARTLQAWVRLEAAAKLSGRGIGEVLTRAGVIGPDKSAARAFERARDMSGDVVGGRGANRLEPPSTDANADIVVERAAARHGGVMVSDLEVPHGYFAALAVYGVPGSRAPDLGPVHAFPSTRGGLESFLAGQARWT